jgi:1-acyl-sn-glycerol-3-phosphate acyltransferase
VALVRLVFRLIGLAAWTAAMYAVLRAGDLTGRLRAGPDRGRGARRSRAFHRWSRGVLALLGVRAEVRGPRPAAPFVLVSNHLSYLDVVLLGSALPCVFVAKAEVERWPVIGALCRAADTLFIDREIKRDVTRVRERIERVLASGRGVVLFPEGTTTRGDAVQPFRPSLLETAAATGLSVAYASLSYRTPPGVAPAELSVCWWGDMRFGSHLLALLSLPEIRATLTFGSSAIQERDRKRLALRLQRAVAEQFQPVT